MISFIIPAYNAEKTIERTVNSIRNLSLDKEIIVVENGSTDGTGALLEKMGEIRVLHSEKGVSRARNEGIRNAKGRWICFADADDEILPGITDALKTAEEGNPDILAASYKKDDDPIIHEYKDTGIITEEKLDDARCWLIGKPTLRMQAWAKLFRREFILENQLWFDESLSFSEDSEFVIRALLKAETLMISSIPIYQYHSGTPSVMRTYSPDRVGKYIDALETAERDVSGQSDDIKHAFRDYVIAHLNIISVHDIFGYDVKMSWADKKARMKELLSVDVIRRAEDTMNISDMKNMNNIPAVLFKHRLIGVGGTLSTCRSLQNKRRYQRARVRDDSK